MATDHPVQTFQTALELARREVIDRLARSSDALIGTDLHLLATIQTALSAVREEMQSHGLGYGGEGTLE
jgi:hypothetical protein